MRRTRARVDENQAEIVKGLRKAGATVDPMHAVGDGFPDLCVGFRSVNYLLEVKNPEKPKRDRQLTPDQKEWHAAWQGQVTVVETIEEALRAIGAIS